MMVSGCILKAFGLWFVKGFLVRGVGWILEWKILEDFEKILKGSGNYFWRNLKSMWKAFGRIWKDLGRI